MPSTVDRRSMSRTRACLKPAAVALTGGVVAIAVGACGGGGGGHTQPATSTRRLTGLAAEPAARILAAAEAAIDRVHTFHLQVTAAIADATVSESTYLSLPGEAVLGERDGASVLDVRALGGRI
jgi:hypothetical protein